MFTFNTCVKCLRLALRRCNGCNQYFCTRCFTNHRKELDRKLDRIIWDSNQLRDSMMNKDHQNTMWGELKQSFSRSLLKSLELAMADPYSTEEAIKKTDEAMSKMYREPEIRTAEIEDKMFTVYGELRKNQERGDFDEKDLDQYERQLTQIRRDWQHSAESRLGQWKEQLEHLRRELVGNCTFGVAFVDLSDTNGYKRVSWSQTAPRWRRALRGMCLEGLCENKTCEAYGQCVVIGIGMGKFDLLADPSSSTTPCPICKQYVEPTTCGFNNCKWRWQGAKQISGQPPIKLSEDWKQVDNAYHYFDQTIKGTTTTSGTCIWRALQIEAQPLSQD